MRKKTDPNISDPVLDAYKRGIDRTLIRENLRLTVEQRFDNLMKLQEFAEELRKSKHSQRKDDNKLR